MPDPLTLLNICNGAAAEIFDRELNQVLENIADINTSSEKRRKIVLTFDFKPYSDRSAAEVSLTCKSTLAPVNQINASAFIVRKDGAVRAFNNDIRQGEMFPTEEPAPREPNVVRMKQ